MKLLEQALPQPPRDYDQSQFNQLIRDLQRILTKDIEGLEEAEEREAQAYFIGN